jgi:hypothetical protein
LQNINVYYVSKPENLDAKYSNNVDPNQNQVIINHALLLRSLRVSLLHTDMINTQQLVKDAKNNVATTIGTPAGAATFPTYSTPGISGIYYLAWTKADGSIWWTTCKYSENQTKYDWEPFTQIPGAYSSQGPALANLNGVIWMAFKGENDDKRIFTASLNGSTWKVNSAIKKIRTVFSPALTSNGSELFLAFMGASDQIYNLTGQMSSSGKLVWNLPETPITNAKSKLGCALASYQLNGDVYLAFRGQTTLPYSDLGLDGIWMAQYSPLTKKWDKAYNLANNAFVSGNAPGLGFDYKGQWWLVWKDGYAHDMRFTNAKYAPSGPEANQQIIGIETSGQPALISQLNIPLINNNPSYSSDLLLVWRGRTAENNGEYKIFIAPFFGITDGGAIGPQFI